MRREQEPEEPKPIGSPGFANSKWIFEQVTQNVYLVFDRVTRTYHVFPYTNAGMSIRDDKTNEDRDYVPLSRLPWPSVRLPNNFDDPETLAQTKEEFIKRINEGPPQNLLPDYETEESLFNEIKAFLIQHLDVANDLFFDVYACFVLASYRTEDFTVIPYQFFLGPLASGKTRALECFSRLCYRAIMASSMSAASLFRSLEAWHPTLLLDETEIYNKEGMVEVLALLNSGYRKGQVAIRIEKLEQGCPQIAFFDTFGFKVLAGTEELAATLQSRCIITSMSKAVRHINLFVDEEKAQELRNKLILYRFKNLGQSLEGFDVSKLNGYFNNARVIELFVSLLQVAPAESIRARLIECMKQITQSRLDEEQASIEARVFDAVLKCESIVENGKLSTQAITEAFNEGLPEKDQGTSRFIGRKVTALGFEKCRLSGGPSGFFWDQKHVDRLRARYYPSTSSNSTSLTSQTSQTSLMMEKTLETSPTTSEVSEDKPSQHGTLETSEKSMNSEVSEESEVSEVSLEGIVNRLEKLERLEGTWEDKCVLCSFSGRMDYQITFHDQTWGLFCGPCGLKIEKRLNEGQPSVSVSTATKL
jgi:hypothetical protein